MKDIEGQQGKEAKVLLSSLIFLVCKMGKSYLPHLGGTGGGHHRQHCALSIACGVSIQAGFQERPRFPFLSQQQQVVVTQITGPHHS